MKKIAIIADDLTGGADTGVQFVPIVDRMLLIPFRSFSSKYPNPIDTSFAYSVYTNSRSMAPDAARKRVRMATHRLLAHAPDWTYKKVDSCLRGNIGAEIEAVMDEMGCALSFIAPAYPEMGRTTIEDIHRIHGIPLAHTEVARDPVTPVTESSLSRIIASQARFPVGHIALHFLQGAENRLQDEIDRYVRRGVKHLAFDSVTQVDLDRIAHLVIAAPHKILPVGSAGLASSLCDHLCAGSVSALKKKDPPARGHRLLVCGTGSEITRGQVDVLLDGFDYQVIRLSPDILAGGGSTATLAKIISRIRSKLARGDVIMQIDASNTGDDSGGMIPRQEMAHAMTRGLGYLVAAVLVEVRPAMLFLTGGDTADAVLSAVNAKGIRILGEIIVGVVEGTLSGGAFDGLPVMTKAGAFGQRETLVTLHNIWQKRIKGSRKNTFTF